MKIIKTRLQNKMQDKFYIQKMAKNFSSNSIIDELKNLKKRTVIF